SAPRASGESPDQAASACCWLHSGLESPQGATSACCWLHSGLASPQGATIPSSRLARPGREIRGLDLLHGRPEHIVGIHPLRLTLEVQNDAVAQRRQREGADIFDRDVEPPEGEGANFPGEDQRLHPARARSVADETAVQ